METEIAEMLFGAAAIAVTPHALVAAFEVLWRQSWVQRCSLVGRCRG